MTSDDEIEVRLARQRVGAPRAGLRGEILARAAQARPRPRPWFAYAVAATIALALAVGQIADRVQSRRIAALMGPAWSAAVAARPGDRDDIGMPALLRRQAELDIMLGGSEWPNGGVGG